MSKNVQLSDLLTGDIIYPETTISQVKDLQTTINTLATKQDIEDVKEEILGDDLTETFNTLKAVQDWADEHGTEYGKLVADVNKKASQDEVNEINGTLNDVQSDLDDVQSELESKVDSSDYEAKIASLESTIESLTSRLATLESKEYSNLKYVAIEN